MKFPGFALLLLLAFPLLCPAEEPTAFFPVMAWDGIPNDAAAIKKMRDCGFTVAGFVPPAALDHCQAVGLKAIVSDARSSGYDWPSVDPKVARERVEALIKEVRNHPAVYGYYLRDEPSASFFPGLAAVSSVIKEQHPGVWPYINLFPNYAHPSQLGTPTYDEYVEKFIQDCKPPVLSYDHYAIFEGGVFREQLYYSNLESIRRAAIKHNLPFWQIVLALGALNFREPTPVDMRMQVYTSLAYGARGIAYFKYFTPNVGNFRSGPIDEFGNENPMWHVLQHVNLQIGKLAPTLLKLKSDRVYHFGTVPEGCSGPDENSLVEKIAGPMLVGDFTHENGDRYIMVVNKDFNASTPCHPKFRTPIARLEVVSSFTGTNIPYEGEQCWLAPGQGFLLKLIPKEKK